MTLTDLQAKNLLESLPTSRDEILGLLGLVDRDIKDAEVEEISLDARFERAYNATMNAAKAVLRCRGYRPKGSGQHRTIFEALRSIEGPWTDGEINYFHQCRKQRHRVQYDCAGIVSAGQLGELLEKAKTFRTTVRQHIKESFPQYLT